MSDASGASGSVPGEYVRLDVPATTEQLRLVRLVVVGLATSHGADVDDLEDLRIATGEICAHLVAHAADDARLAVIASVEDEGAAPSLVRVRATIEGSSGPGVADGLDELSEMVLATTTRAFGIESSEGSDLAWFERAVHVPSEPLGGRRPDG